MLHFSAQVRCRHCDYPFFVCVHTEGPLDSRTQYAVRCPMNNSHIVFRSELLHHVDCCPEGATEGHIYRPAPPVAVQPAPPVAVRTAKNADI